MEIPSTHLKYQSKKLGDNFYLLVMVRGADSNLIWNSLWYLEKPHSMNNFVHIAEISACIDR